MLKEFVLTSFHCIDNSPNFKIPLILAHVVDENVSLSYHLLILVHAVYENTSLLYNLLNRQQKCLTHGSAFFASIHVLFLCRIDVNELATSKFVLIYNTSHLYLQKLAM